MAEQKEDNVFFVGVKYPIELRRNILESLKDVVDNLHKFESFKAVREAKAREMENLNSTVKEIDRLLSKLKSALPKTNLRIQMHAKDLAMQKKEEKKKKALTQKKKEVVREEKKKESTELERLEKELDIIESKLKDLS